MQLSDLNIALETLLEVTDSLFADHWLEPPSQYGGGDESPHDDQNQSGGDSSEPDFFSARHKHPNVGKTVRLAECFQCRGLAYAFDYSAATCRSNGFMFRLRIRRCR